MKEMYCGQLGIDEAVYNYGNNVLENLKERFEAIDEVAEYNQLKVIAAMQKNRVAEMHLSGTSGYGYNDEGRDTLERVYADIFKTEDALVRPQIICGTHALNVAISSNLRPGDELLSPVGKPYDTMDEIIGIRPSKGSLAEYNISYRQVDLLDDGSFDYDGIRKAINEKTKALYIETLGNPNSDVVDIESVARIAHRHKIPLVVDNTFATPYLVRPIEYGADIVVHSATKFIGGHGTSIGGVIVDGGKFDWEASGKFDSLTKPNPSYHGISFTKACGPAAFVTKVRAILLRDTGATVSPFNAFLFLQGLETLSLRVERHTYNALKVVEYLNNHTQVESVSHPSVSTDPKQQELYKKYFPNGGGSIFTFDIKGDAQKAKDFIDNLELFSLLANVADVKSLVIHPATTTHSQCTEDELLDQGIRPNTIRLSIGCENIDDIIQDLDEAFKAVA